MCLCYSLPGTAGTFQALCAVILAVHRGAKVTRLPLTEDTPWARSARGPYRRDVGGKAERTPAETFKAGTKCPLLLLLMCRFLGPDTDILALRTDVHSESALDGEGVGQFSQDCFRNSKTKVHCGMGRYRHCVMGCWGQSPTWSSLNTPLSSEVCPLHPGHPGDGWRKSHSSTGWPTALPGIWRILSQTP